MQQRQPGVRVEIMANNCTRIRLRCHWWSSLDAIHSKISTAKRGTAPSHRCATQLLLQRIRLYYRPPSVLWNVKYVQSITSFLRCFTHNKTLHVPCGDVHGNGIPNYAKNGNGNGKSTRDNRNGSGYVFMCAKITAWAVVDPEALAACPLRSRDCL